MTRTIRRAQEADLPQILAIYNHVIATSTAIYSEEPATLDDRARWLEARGRQGYPVLVAETGQGVVGFASFGEFRPWPGFRHSVEHSVHVAHDRRNEGHGGELMRALLAEARDLGKHVMVAGVDGENAGSIRFHERLGFVASGKLSEVGFKFGRFLDLVFLVSRL